MKTTLKRFRLLASAFFLVSASPTIGAIRYVNLNNTTPESPYTSWPTAATNIQDCVDVAVAGDEIVVTNGIYESGSRLYADSTPSRVVIDKAVLVRSVNGPAATVIRGARAPGSTNGVGAIRCVYLADGGILSGFTLTNGATAALTSQRGGGIRAESTGGVVTNCVLAGNAAYGGGGGAYNAQIWDSTLTRNSGGSAGGAALGGILNRCTLSHNSSSVGGGASSNLLFNCMLVSNTATWGGGAAYATLNACTLDGNSAGSDGGGAFDCVIDDSALIRNSARWYGGAAYRGFLNRCSLIQNSAITGGGVINATVVNSVVSSNSASSNGGGAANSLVRNSRISENSANEGGGGTYQSTNINCTIVRNTASNSGGGILSGFATNCIVYFNSAPAFANFKWGTLHYCCTTPLPLKGVGNFDSDPQLAGPTQLSVSSPCRSAGLTEAATGTDINGDPWLDPPSVGCDEHHSPSLGNMTVAISASHTNVAVGFAVQLDAIISGPVTASRWEFGDGTVASNRIFTTHTWAVSNHYPVTLRAYNDSYPQGVTATVVVRVLPRPVFHVRASGSPVAPFATWQTAATNIQTAINAATLPGSLILVSNGIYGTGSASASGNNRVAVTKPVIVQSVNGPEFTIIRGSRTFPVARCVYLGPDAMLSGFALTNGGTADSGYASGAMAGGGVYASPGSVISNCVITLNVAHAGGGAFGGILKNCVISNNIASIGGGSFQSVAERSLYIRNSAPTGDGGGAAHGTLTDCTFIENSTWRGGGGAAYSAVDRCFFMANSVTWSNSSGGGVYEGTINNSLVLSNSATGIGGGIGFAEVNHCTIIGNSALRMANAGGGLAGGSARNSIILSNFSPGGENNYAGSPLSLDYCCTVPMPTNGVGNITSPPMFANAPDGNWRLISNSPCIDAGWNSFVQGSGDLDGRPRVVGMAVDIGAYEYQGPDGSAYLDWLNAYGFSRGIESDDLDSDSDGLNTWQEWLAGTDPTDAASLLAMINVSRVASGMEISWLSVTNRSYILERAALVSGPFSLIASNLMGQPNITRYTDNPVPAASPYFYRARTSR